MPQRREISIEARIDKGIGSIVMDEAKFRQIIFQLFDNAVKFTPAKGKVGIDAAIIKRINSQRAQPSVIL